MLKLSVTIPGNTTGIVYVPVVDGAEVEVVATGGTAAYRGATSGYASYNVTSGTYVFTTSR
jgi:hypothetical protein